MFDWRLQLQIEENDYRVFLVFVVALDVMVME